MRILRNTFLVLLVAALGVQACGGRTDLLPSVGRGGGGYTAAVTVADAAVPVADAPAIKADGTIDTVDALACLPIPCASDDDCRPFAPFCRPDSSGGKTCTLTCGQPGEDIVCDIHYCADTFPPRYPDGGTLYGDCQSGWCRCYILSRDGTTRSLYLDNGQRPACR